MKDADTSKPRIEGDAAFASRCPGRGRRVRIAAALCVLGLWVAHPGLAAEDEPEEMKAVSNRFVATKPTVVMEYTASYSFLFFEFKNVARATLSGTEGLWRQSDAGDWIPACLLCFQTVDAAAAGRRDGSDVKLNKRTVGVATLPDLHLITYVKANDEYVKPLFRAGRRMKYVEVYDFSGGGLDYFHRDLVSGAVDTNLVNREALARQSREISDVLKGLYNAYLSPAARQEVKLEPKAHFTVDGAVQTFDLYAIRKQVSVPVLGRRVDALDCRLQRQDGSENQDEAFSMSCVPLRSFAAWKGARDLQDVAAGSLEWTMVPLSGRLELFIGGIDCTMTNVVVRSGPGLRPAGD